MRETSKGEMRRGRWPGVLVLLTCLYCCSGTLLAETTEAEAALSEVTLPDANQPESRQAGRSAGEPNDSGGIDVSRSLGSAPWYDDESGSVRPMKVIPRIDDSIHRDSRWLPKPKQLKKKSSTNSSTTNTTTTAGGSGGFFGTGFSLGNLLGWVLLIAGTLAMVGLIAWAISRAEMRLGKNAADAAADAAKSGLPDEQMLERIKHLPPELRRTDVNLRTECERLMQIGRLDQAIILLLGHQLLLLDRFGLLRLNRGKTNGRYVRETRTNDSQCAQWLRETADAFEQSYFGRYQIGREVFDVLWTQNAELETRVQNWRVG